MPANAQAYLEFDRRPLGGISRDMAVLFTDNWTTGSPIFPLWYLWKMRPLLWIVLFFDALATGKKHHRRAGVPFQHGSTFQDANLSPFPSLSTPPSISTSDSPTPVPPPPFPVPQYGQPPDLPVVIQGDALKVLPRPYLERSSNVSTPPSQISKAESPQSPLVMGYYPDWATDTFPPEKLDFARYDWLDFAFAVPTSEFGLEWDSEGAPSILARLVTAAHVAQSKVKLSIGGWTGSKFFSRAVATAESRQTFANNIFQVYSLYNLDGIDIDWEYPGHEGNRGNLYDRSDTRNFLDFLRVLRNTLPPSARITAAVQTFPFMDETGQPLLDTSAFATVLDWVLIMNYDTWGASSSPGPNAPLYDACGNSTQPEASALASYKAWTASGFPASKLVLGLPAYGYVERSAAQRLRNRDYGYRGRHRTYHDYTYHSDHFGHEHPVFDHGPEDGYSGGWSGGYNGHDDDGDGDGDIGDNSDTADPSYPRPLEIDDDEDQIQFRDLVKQGALTLLPISTNDTYARYQGSGGFERRWDSCSETPFLRSTSAGQIVTYDDPESLALKARFAKEAGMLGVNIFDVHGDTDNYDLADSIRNAMGLSSNS